MTEYRIIAKDVKNGTRIVRQSLINAGMYDLKQRQAQCQVCPENKMGRCQQCKCIISALIMWPFSKCPLGRWHGVK